MENFLYFALHVHFSYAIQTSSSNSDEKEQIDQAQSTFWREWKLKLEEQKRFADRSRSLEQILPGVEAARFLSGDMDYRENVVLSFVESITPEKKQSLKDVLKLTNTYGLDCNKVCTVLEQNRKCDGEITSTKMLEN